MVVSRLVLASPTDEHTGRLSDEVELYQRTYNTLLRSSGETHLRVLEPAHRAMGSSLHPLADSDEPDLGAFIYAIRRMPDSVADGAQLVILGQEREVFAKNGISIDEWPEADAPARRRRWYDAGDGTHAVLIASASDVDDLIPTLVAFQIEWNKLRVRQRAAAGRRTTTRREESAEALGGTPEDWARLREALGRALPAAPAADRRPADEHARADARRHAGRLRADDAPLVAAGPRLAGGAGPRRPAALLRQLEHAQPRQHRDGRGAPARGRCWSSSWRAAGGRHPALGA